MTGGSLTERQAAVLRAVVASYVGDGQPIGSRTIASLLPVALSSASVRNTLAELTTLGLVEKPHKSSGRVPTERGLRRFVNDLLAPADLPASDRRDIDYSLDLADVAQVPTTASGLLSRHTRHLGFVFAPRLERLVLRRVSVVRLSSERLLAVLVASSGLVHQRVIDDAGDLAQPELDRIGAILSERVAGRTLTEVRASLEREMREQRREADRLLARALDLGARALAAEPDADGALVIQTTAVLLDQPEFSDPRRLRELFEAIETRERLLDVIHQVLDPVGVSVGIGDELDDPALRQCALVATPYGESPDAPCGVLGVLGPARMDFARVIPTVAYLSRAVSGRLRA